MVLKALYIIVISFVVFISNVETLSTEQIKENYAKMIVECFNDHPISSDDLKQLKNKMMPDNDTAKCLFACAYRKAGMMNEKGELSVDGVNEIAQKFFSDDVTKIKKSEDFTNACKSVNDEVVADGEKGCERAALIFKCTVDKSPEFDFV